MDPIVSANNLIRDEVRTLVREHLNRNVRMVELEYQPHEK